MTKPKLNSNAGKLRTWQRPLASRAWRSAGVSANATKFAEGKRIADLTRRIASHRHFSMDKFVCDAESAWSAAPGHLWPTLSLNSWPAVPQITLFCSSDEHRDEPSAE